jgi:hypothetical protein
VLSTANDLSILEATIHLPRSGVWHADLTVDTGTPSQVTGAVALSLFDGQLALAGTSWRPPQLWRGVTRLRWAAGAAGMSTPIGPQGYASAPYSLIVGDILAAAGETLSATSMPLATRTAWVRLAEDNGTASAGTCLQAVVDELGAVWRTLVDGTIWVGAETWAAWTVTDYQVTDSQPEDDRIELVTSAPTLLPGMSFTPGDAMGGNVGRVIYRVRSDAIRTEVFFET